MKQINADNPDLQVPTGLSRKGRKAAFAILKCLEENSLWDNNKIQSGGCKLFYSPKEWKDRGEIYGRESELIVCYDGGDAYSYFSYNSESYSFQEKMVEALQAAGVWSEPCTGWYSGIYPL